MASSSTMDGAGPGLPRSTSVKATPMSPLHDDDDDQQPARASISTPSTQPRQTLHPVSCTAADTPAETAGKEKHRKPASYYASMWSPRRLMERASRAFRSAGKSRRRKNKDAVVVGDTDSPVAVASLGSDAARALSFEEQIVVDVHGGGDHRLEVVPEKIIHEANLPEEVNLQPPAVEAQQEEERVGTTDNEVAAAVDDEPLKTPTPETETETETAVAEEADHKEEEEDGELMKGAGPAPSPAPAPAPVVAAAAAVTVDCKLEQAKEEAMKKREEEIMTAVVRRFQGSRVKTSVEQRPGGGEQLSSQTRRRASNEVIEEARTKLLEMRQGSKVKALVGAFETVMDANSPRTAASTPAAGNTSKPHLHYARTFTL